VNIFGGILDLVVIQPCGSASGRAVRARAEASSVVGADSRCRVTGPDPFQGGRSQRMCLPRRDIGAWGSEPPDFA